MLLSLFDPLWTSCLTDQRPQAADDRGFLCVVVTFGDQPLVLQRLQLRKPRLRSIGGLLLLLLGIRLLGNVLILGALIIGFRLLLLLVIGEQLACHQATASVLAGAARGIAAPMTSPAMTGMLSVCRRNNN